METLKRNMLNISPDLRTTEIKPYCIYFYEF